MLTRAAAHGRRARCGLRCSALCLLAALALAPGAEAWGFTAHRMVNRKAIATLPQPLRPLFEANAAYVAEHAIDPDLWRAAGRAGEAPNHYLDLDAFGAYPFPGIPRLEAEHRARYGPDAAGKGRLPWRVGEVYGELVAAFRAKDPARILERAAVLGHYLGDAHVPFHAVTDYDGQASGQTGIHDRWESELVERFERQIEPRVRPAPARRVTDPVAFAFEALLVSYQEVAPALASDRACAGPKDLAATAEDDRYGDAYYTRLFERERERLLARLTASSAAVGSLWLSAWEEAGRPSLPAFRFPYVRGQARAILVSLDGASAPLLDDAVARGVMPHLARLRAGGAAARGMIASMPAKTAAGHAALFTGAWPDVNGIAGNDVPLPEASVLDVASGYLTTPLRAEPLWVTAARQGLEATVATGTQVFPFDPFLDERRFGGNFGRRLTLLDGYRNRNMDDAVYRARDFSLRPARGWALPRHVGEPKEFTLSVSGALVEALLFDDPDDPVAGFDSLYLASRRDSRDGITLKPRPPLGTDPSAFAALALKVHGGEAGVHFRLFALSPDASDLLLYRSRAHVLASSKPRVASAALEATGGYVGNGAFERYEVGDLGLPLWAGGDGTAERRYLETVSLNARQLTRLTDFCLDHAAWDLLVTYLPQPDEADHVWLGLLDPTLPEHDPALAVRVRPFVDEVLRVADAFVGHLAERAGSDVLLAVASDHGAVGASAVVRPNVVLARAGILSLDGSGGVDLSRTRAVYFPGNSGYVLISRVSRFAGIVRPEQEEGVRREVSAALRALADPATGRAVIVDVVDPRDAGPERGLGGPAGGDLYLTLARGYALLADTTGEPVQHGPPRGVHFQDPERAEMQAAFVVAGPGVAAGADLGTIRLIDVAPTLCTLLGIDPPAQATGVVLDKALARRTPTAGSSRR